MRVVRLAGAVAAALTLAASPAVAGHYYVPGFPIDEVTVYGDPPFGPPLGYVFEPSDPRAPVRIANQGPVISGPGVYAHHELEMPTWWWQGGYAVVTPHGYPTPFPYVRHVPDVRVFSSPVGVAPYAASVYWPASRAHYRRAVRRKAL